jgi:hypothetical protein
MLVCAVFVALFVSPVSAMGAGAVTDTVSVHIGYFGWDEDQFVEKAAYNWRELDDLFGGALSTREHVYSYYSGSRTYLVAARGFYIRDLLELAGIDFGSISRIDFFTKDQTIGAYRSFTKSSLFDMPRYYFPNLAADANTGEVYPYEGDDIYDSATRVEPMLALEDYTEWDSVGSMFEQLYDSTMFSASSRFHLFFGQLSPTEANTSSAAKYVYKLFITFSGTPILSADETNIDLKVGSDFRMSVHVSAEDSLLNDYVRDNLAWSSSDGDVVMVDNAGGLTVKSEGDAVITASFGASSVSVAVRVAGDDDVSVDVATLGENGDCGGYEGSGGNTAGQGQAYESIDDESVDADAEAMDTDSMEKQNNTAADGLSDETDDFKDRSDVSSAENVRSIYMLSPEFISRKDFEEWARTNLHRKYIEGSEDGALNNARREGMDEDAQQLVLLPNTVNSHMTATALVIVAFFASGFGYGIVSYRRKL